MNQVIDLMNNHVSAREFVPGADIDEATLHQIIDAGRHASTWRALQSYSVIVIRDQGLKEEISGLTHQAAIKNCAVFLVFVGDLARANTSIEMHADEARAQSRLREVAEGKESVDESSEKHCGKFQPGLVEGLLVPTVDASLCAQNILLAAESLGLGGCFIGMIRTKSEEISELLGLAKYQFPIFGMVLGHPANPILPKPRLPYDGAVFQNHYNDDEAARIATIKQHEADLVGYPDPRPMTFSERQLDQWGKPGQTSSTQNLHNHGFPI